MRYFVVICIFLILLSSASAFLVDPGSTGFGSQNRSNNGKNMTREWLADNASQIISFGGNNYFVVPWFSNADSTSMDTDLHAFQNGSWSKSNITFPSVTDEFTRATYASVLYDQNDTVADAIINTILYINDSGNTYTNGHVGGYDIEWTFRVNFTTVWNIYKDQVADTASDAGAYALLTLLRINTSGAYSASNSNRAGARAALLCVQFANNSYYNASALALKNRVNPGQTFNFFPAGGSNVNGNLGNGDFTYQAYDGPMLEALAGCHNLLGDSGAFNYSLMAEDQFQLRLVAANWTGTTAPLGPGRAYSWYNISSGQQVEAQCTNSCTNASGAGLGTEDPDSERSPDICRAAWVWSNFTGRTLQNSSVACQKFASIKCLTNTTYGYTMTYDGTTYGSGGCSNSGFRPVGLGESLFFMWNSTQMSAMLDQYNSHVQNRGGHINMDGQNAFGVYDKSFGLTDQAYATGLADTIFNGSTPSGGGGGCDVAGYRANMTKLACSTTACTFVGSTCTDTSVRSTTTKQCTASTCA